jgi:hypothetical protein
MKTRMFNSLPEVENFQEVKMNVGTKFLFGLNMIRQKEDKVGGDSVTYYEVTSITKSGGVEYKAIYDKLDKGEEE